jgi:hypothetical protein
MIPSLPERLTLNKKFSAYCEVCWRPVYCLWIDSEPHGGVCVHGHSKAHECPDAMGEARLIASLRKYKAAAKEGGNG